MCRFEGCDRKTVGQGLCGAHWAQRKRGGEESLRPIQGALPKDTQCSFYGCTRPVSALGLCGGHYKQQAKGAELSPLGRQISALDRDSQGRKYCPRCSQWRPVGAFGNHKSRPDGLRYECKDCTRVRSTLDKYGLTVARYDEMVEAQGGACAICSTPCTTFVVDHDHDCCPGQTTCGKCVRGLLCGTCNSGIGLLKDSSDVLRKAAAYLERRSV